MSLFGSLQLASNALRATQIGIHVVGNNIANANTPGFIREEVLYSPAPTQKVGRLTLGLGVQIDAIVQKADRFLAERLRDATSDRASADVQAKAFKDLETLIGELSDTDLSTSLSTFFGALNEVAKSPNDVSLRNLAVGSGKALTADVRRLSQRSVELHNELDRRVGEAGDEINLLAEKVRLLNLRIAGTEGGSASNSEAGGLRSERNNALAQLAELIDVTVTEQPNGTTSVAVGGEFLVFEGRRREVEAIDTVENGLSTTNLRFVDNAADLSLTGGEVYGLYQSRDGALGSFVEGLDRFAQTLAFEFNKLHTQGQGLTGFQSLTAQEGVTDVNASLDAAGLPFTPVNGSFDFIVRNRSSDTTQTTTINVDLSGLDGDTSLESLRAAIDAVDGVSASIDLSGKLSIAADSEDLDFAFSGDTSGALAALGLNTFFTGFDARTININAELDGVANAGKLAASLIGVGSEADNENALRLAGFLDSPLDVLGGATLADSYDQLVNEVTTGSTIASSVADGFAIFEATLQGEEQAISGVNIDEEAINLIQLQRSYQASARYVRTISDLLDVLVNL